LMIEAE